MSGTDIQIRSSADASFDCYLVLPEGETQVPAVVLACAIFGVDADLRAIADEFARSGFIAAAPDLFWRTTPGALVRGDPRATPRGQPRLDKIRTGEADLADTLAVVRGLPQSNGRAAAMGFCYGGPFAILGPARLGFDAGIGCHSTQMQDYIGDLAGVSKPVCLMWGDMDTAAPAEVLDAYRAAAVQTPNLDLHVFPGILHGYMMPGSPEAFDAQSRAFSMARALELLQGLRQPA